ncbi:TadE/TadG family type IV pilus assembly protein [Yersinia artesiana]|uniref:TadE/TadG family type IV pilus assembly protein n=2 Tax=Yersinia artesiana TaxID=2890315 RepID=UPI001F34AF9C|nr:TadE/TadG family type IV pilus assembly protein [Yersinia artesiana]
MLPLRFFYSNRGSITIEFLIVFTIFLIIFLSSAEIARLIYISANMDLSVSEAAKSAKNKESTDNTNYTSMLQEKLATYHGVLGPFIAENNNVSTNVIFSENISDLINNKTSTDNKLPLAKYSVSYQYRPIFFPMSSSWANTLLLREVIFAQEN